MNIRGRLCPTLRLSPEVAKEHVRTYTTPRVSMHLSSVTSNRARELTDGQWKSKADYKDDHEVPPDGLIKLQFSRDVDTALLASAFKLLTAGSL